MGAGNTAEKNVPETKVDRLVIGRIIIAMALNAISLFKKAVILAKNILGEDPCVREIRNYMDEIFFVALGQYMKMSRGLQIVDGRSNSNHRLRFIQKVVIPQTGDGNEDAVQLLYFCAVYLEGEPQRIAREELAKLGQSQNLAIKKKTQEIFGRLSFDDKMDPSLIHVLVKFDSYKAVEVAKKWAHIRNSACQQQALLLLAEPGLECHIHGDTVRHLDFWSSKMAEDHKLRASYYRLVEKSLSHRFSKEAEPLGFIVPAYGRENDPENLETLNRLVARIDPEKSREHIFRGMASAVGACSNFLRFNDGPVEIFYKSLPKGEKAQFLIMALQKPGRNAWEIATELLKQEWSEDSLRALEESTKNPANTATLLQLVLKVAYEKHSFAEQRQAIKPAGLKCLIQMIKRLLDQESDPARAVVFISAFADYGEQDILDAALAKAKAIVESAENEPATKAINSVWIIRARGDKKQQAEVDKAMAELILKRSDLVRGVVKENLKKNRQGAHSIRLSSPAMACFATIPGDALVHEFGSVLNQITESEAKTYVADFLAAKAIGGSSMAVRRLGADDGKTHTFPNVAELLFRIFKSKAAKEVKSSALEEICRRFYESVVNGPGYRKEGLFFGDESVPVKALSEEKAVQEMLIKIATDLSGTPNDQLVAGLAKVIKEMDSLIMSDNRERFLAGLENTVRVFQGRLGEEIDNNQLREDLRTIIDTINGILL